MSVASCLAFVAIFVLPGALPAFSPLFGRMDGWRRLLFATVLSIPLASLAYEFLRAAGAGPDLAVTLLPVLSLPALALIWRSRADFAWPGSGRAAAVVAGLAVPVVFLAATFAWFPEKVFWGHTWLHADMIEALRANPFAPEERQLAGLKATYPWYGHLFFLIQSTALDMSPLVAFTWVNLVLAAAYGGFAMACTRALGGSFPAILAAPALFAFAVNPAGVAIGRTMNALGSGPGRWAYVLGDPRYDFMLIKHMRLNLNQVAITLMAGLILLAIAPPRPGRAAWLQTATIAIMVLVLTLLYPLYMPVALAVAGARALALILIAPRRNLADAAMLCLAAGLAAVLGAWLVTAPLGPRATGLGVALAGPGHIWRHGVMTATALSLPAAAAFWLLRERFRALPVATAVLVLSALGCAVLSVFVHIPNKANEYKFVLAAGVALLPFLAVAAGRLLDAPRPRLGRAALALLAALCTGAALDSVSRRSLDPGRAPATLVLDGIHAELDPADPLAGAVAAIRDGSPPDAVLLAEDTVLELSVLTLRAQYVPADPERTHPGMTFGNDYLLTNVKGYAADLVRARHRDLDAILHGTDAAAREVALGDVARLGRPIVLLLAAGRNPGAEQWLAQATGARALYGDANYRVWLLPAPR